MVWGWVKSIGDTIKDGVGWAGEVVGAGLHGIQAAGIEAQTKLLNALKNQSDESEKEQC